jgi:hypothetical protein
MGKIMFKENEGSITTSEWNQLIKNFFTNTKVKVKRISFSDATISSVLSSSSENVKGLGIILDHPSPTGNINQIIQLGIWDGTNEDLFTGIIATDVLKKSYKQDPFQGLGLSIGKNSKDSAELVVLVDVFLHVKQSDGSIKRPLKGGGNDGGGGDNLTPCKIPA